MNLTVDCGSKVLLKTGHLKPVEEGHFKAELTTESYEDAPIKIDSFAMADGEEGINGDALYDLIQEAKSKGVTVASLLHKLPNATSRVIVSPGPGVVEQAPRSGGKKRT